MLNLELSVEETQIVLVALSKLPYEAVANLIDKIKMQAQPQVQATEQQAE